ncbi:hypothetical protein [Effusibacillus pohliae]|uniref:hypothetical protein n=1 Tax=Effusibacillus pohliae TaxID=232270 RepID=UPI00037D851B|nr:hypothetical protein [Effusibacillus pohliae]
MTHVEHATQGTIELAERLLEQIKNGKNIDIQVAKKAVRARLVQIMSLLSMDVAPSPWITKKNTVRELIEQIEKAESSEQILDIIRLVSQRLK